MISVYGEPFRVSNEEVAVKSRHYPQTCLEKLRKAAEMSNVISSPPKLFEPRLAKYMSQTLSLQQPE